MGQHPTEQRQMRRVRMKNGISSKLGTLKEYLGPVLTGDGQQVEVTLRRPATFEIACQRTCIDKTRCKICKLQPAASVSQKQLEQY